MKRRSIAYAILCSMALLPTVGYAQTWEGRVENVRDGDTIDIQGVPEVSKGIRLYGIDTPESKQTCDDASGRRYLCGSAAAQALAQLIGRNGRVRCEHVDWDRYGRSVSECFAGDVNLNAAMVRSGWAARYADRRYSDGRYATEEAAARQERVGLWAGAFVLPWDWRKGQRLPSEVAASSQPTDVPRIASTTAQAGGRKAGCDLKGNISSNGNRIVHSPGQRDYDRTRIDEASGERWFCSLDEAQKAGWRPASR